MMKSIVEEKLVSFKTLEQKIFSYVWIGQGNADSGSDADGIKKSV